LQSTGMNSPLRACLFTGVWGMALEMWLLSQRIHCLVRATCIFMRFLSYFWLFELTRFFSFLHGSYFMFLQILNNQHSLNPSCWPPFSFCSQTTTMVGTCFWCHLFCFLVTNFMLFPVWLLLVILDYCNLLSFWTLLVFWWIYRLF
jgi:hypothetical protein